MNLAPLQKKLGYTFRNPALLQQALTHNSVSDLNYQSLEFVGDRVLALALCEWVAKNPSEDPEDNTPHRVMQVAEANIFLAIIARKIGLPGYLHAAPDVVEGDIHQLSKTYADMLEALVCAIYRDGGISKVKAFIAHHFPLKEMVENAIIDPPRRLKRTKDAPRILARMLRKKRLSKAEYDTVRKERGNNMVLVTTPLGSAIGIDRTIPRARTQAATELLLHLSVKKFKAQIPALT